jgi:hypothetical protein
VYTVQERLSLLQWRLARENEKLLSLLQAEISLSRADKILSAQTGRWQGRTPSRNSEK